MSKEQLRMEMDRESKLARFEREVELAERAMRRATKWHRDVMDAPDASIFFGKANDRYDALKNLRKAEKRLEKAQSDLDFVKAYCARTRG